MGGCCAPPVRPWIMLATSNHAEPGRTPRTQLALYVPRTHTVRTLYGLVDGLVTFGRFHGSRFAQAPQCGHMDLSHGC